MTANGLINNQNDGKNIEEKRKNKWKTKISAVAHT